MTTRRPAPVKDYHDKPVLSVRVPRESLDWARGEAKRRGEAFGDYIDGLITGDRDRATSPARVPVAARQEQPPAPRQHAQTCTCGVCHPKEGKR